MESRAEGHEKRGKFVSMNTNQKIKFCDYITNCRETGLDYNDHLLLNSELVRGYKTYFYKTSPLIIVHQL